ncbi:hypothetical protein ACN23B_04790 [Anabaena sp. FACHB-709]|uniref:Uncharacterized protein n=1 Tax=Trichormus variabilis NIES-23 TaxID=1973479 RepID=A0A1Z4KSF2_ANAVA|nr:hypothetical protein DSM107007_40190 [Nostoc sp. PCC 7120 = FACHB-418]BAB72913.1 all0956 [Nostoc sp. PCC 7120 = FACHB-418]BAY71930.1 hypothetical protein NIES23_47540 [Trichormus variabilis NIES-23]
MKADSFVFELRQWVNNYNAEPFTGECFSPAIPKEQLLERYYSHTIKCASCGNALAKIQKLRLWSGVITVISYVMGSYAEIQILLFPGVKANESKHNTELKQCKSLSAMWN